MKTVEILAKQLNSWPANTTGIFMSPDTGAFFGWRVGFEYPQSIHTECLSGFQPADDAGTDVTEYDFREEKSRLSRTPLSSSINQPSDEQLRKENLYHTKLQCLAEVLGVSHPLIKTTPSAAQKRSTPHSIKLLSNSVTCHNQPANAGFVISKGHTLLPPYPAGSPALGCAGASLPGKQTLAVAHHPCLASVLNAL